MQSITLQTNDSIVSSGDFLGQIQFAASNELDAGASRYIIGRIYSEAEGSFTSSANPASLVFATSANDNIPASGKIKISHEGHILPLLDNAYDLGSPDLRFRDLYVTSEVTSPSGNFDSLFFNTTLADIDQVEGQLNWNDTLGTLDLGLTDTLTTHLGQDVFYRVINLSGGTIYKGQAVYAAGVNAGGQRIEVAKFIADGSIAEVRYIGLLAETLNQGDVGYVTHFGHVRKVDLRSSNTALNPNAETWAAGDILFPDSSTAGGLTKVPPQDTIYTAIVLTDGQNGELLVRITDPGHINDLHDVNTSGVADNNFLVWNSGADYWEPSSGLYYVDGDLGIGNSSPNATLHVYSPTPSGTIFNAEGTQGSLFSVVDNLSGTLMSVNTIAGLPVLEVNSDYSVTAGRFNQNDFVITSSGDIGIGTANPTEKLDIRYPVGGGMALLKSTDITDGLLFGDMAYSTNNSYQGIKHVGMTGTLDYMIMSEGVNTYISSKAGGITVIGAGGNDTNSQIQLKPNSEVVVNENSSNIDFRVESNNNTHMLFIDGITDTVGIGNSTPLYQLDVVGTGNFSGDVYVSGNVGVGTNSPNAVLHAYGSTPSGTVFNVEGTNGSLFSVVDNLSGVLMSVNNNAGLPVFEVYDDDSIIAGRFAQNDFVVSSGGNVGIGTDSPVTKLDVSGVITATGGDSDEWNQSYDWVAASGGLPYVTGVGTANQVAFFNDTDSITSESNLYWDSGNNRLGIGTSSPNMLLHIDNSAGAGVGDRGFQLDGIKFNTGYGAGLAIQPVASESVAVLIAANTSDQANSAKTIFRVTDNTYSTPWLNIVGGGNVGIGTSSPSYKLHVAGDISANANNIYGGGFAVYGDTNNKLTKSGNDFTLSAGQTTTDVHLGYYDGGTLNKVVTVDSSEDRVGILNTAPAYTLDVTGSGNFTGDVYTSGNIGIGTNSLSHNFVINKTGKEPDSAMKSSSGSSASMFNEGGSLPGLLIGMSSSNSYTHRGSVYMNRSRGTLDSPEAVQDGDWLGSYYGAGYDGSALRRMGGVIFVVDGTVSAGNVPTSIMFQTGSSSRTEKMRITHDGKLGIGTSSPAYTLDVNGDSNLGGNVIVGGNLTVNGTTISTNVDTIEIQDPIITLGLTSGNIVTDDSYDRGVAMVTNDGTAFMGWDNSEDKFVMLSSGVATNGSGNYDAGTYGNLQIADLTASGATFDGNVGIGITSPLHKIEVDGNVATSGLYIKQSDSTYRLIYSDSINNVLFNALHIKAGYTVGVNGQRGNAQGMGHTGSDLGLYTSSNERIRITSGGNVGIGDSSPSYKLDVAGTTAITPTAATETLILGRNGGYASITSTYNTALILDSNAEPTYINHYVNEDIIMAYGGGDVGIGTLSPSAKLDINTGTNRALIGSPSFTWGGNTSSIYPTLYSSNSTAWVMHVNPHISYVENGVNGYTGSMNGSTIRFAGNTAASTYWDIGIGTNAVGTDKLSIGRGGSTNFLAINNAGNVGIGTASPSEKLRVYGDVNSHLTIKAVNPNTGTSAYGAVRAESHNAGVGIFGYADNYSGSRYGLSTGGMSEVMALGSPSGLLVGTAANDVPIVFGNDNTERMRIAAGGNVGIGTTSPSYKLDITTTSSEVAQIALRNTSTGSAGIFYDASNGDLVGSDYAWVGQRNNLTFEILTMSGAGDIILSPGATEKVRFAKTGNVGIGTTAPTTLLDVSGVITASGGNSNEWNQAYDWIQNSGLDGTGSASGVAFWTDANTLSYDSGLMWDSGNNRLSIGNPTGTYYPLSSLQVLGDITLGTNIVNDAYRTLKSAGCTIIEGSDANHRIIIRGNQSTNGTVTANTANMDFYEFGGFNFYTNVNTAANSRVHAVTMTSGKVGIATTSPTQQLDIRYPVGGGMALLKSTDTNDGLLFGDMAYSASNTYQGIKHVAHTGIYDYMLLSDGTNTFLSAKDGYSVVINAGGDNTNSQIRVKPDEIVINEQSSSNDFRVESNNNANMLFVDGVSDMVGIGTGSPAQVLHVYGGTISSERSAAAGSPPSTYLSDITTTAASGIGSFHSHRFSTASSADFAGKYGILQTSASSYSRQFQVYVTDSVTPKMIVDGNGNVGIGTTSPSNKLHIQGSSDQLRLSDGTLAFTVGYDNNYLRFKNSAGDTHTVINWSNGNIGIGTTTPAVKLEVQGAGSGSGIQDGLVRLRSTNASNPPGLMFINSGNTSTYNDLGNIQGVIESGNAIGGLRFITRNSDGNNTGVGERVRISAAGNVGIGTSSPTTQLDVVGSGNFSGDVTIDGHLSAATKSFYIDHPTKEGKLQYGSLESPYHGVRLTGRGKIEGGKCVVELPDYVNALVHDDNNVNIQITNYKHSKTLYVNDININDNQFTVKYDGWFGGNGLEFFWSFTAVRKDVQELKVEC